MGRGIRQKQNVVLQRPFCSTGSNTLTFRSTIRFTILNRPRPVLNLLSLKKKSQDRKAYYMHINNIVKLLLFPRGSSAFGTHGVTRDEAELGHMSLSSRKPSALAFIYRCWCPVSGVHD